MINPFTKLSISGYIIAVFLACSPKTEITDQIEMSPNLYKDTLFLQDYSIKYFPTQEHLWLQQVASDRNGHIQVLSSEGLLHVRAGQMLYPGTLVPDERYRTSRNKSIAGMTLYDNQFVCVDDVAILSHAWAGRLFERHNLPSANLVAGGDDFTFLVG